MSHDVIKKIVDVLKKEKKFTLFTHEAPDGDCIGSQLAVAKALRKLKKDVIVVSEKLPVKYCFLPGVDEVLLKQPQGRKDDRVAIFFDTTSIERKGGECDKDLSGFKLVINIDHHVSNSRFGDINWIDSKASSVGEMVFHIIEALKMRSNKEIATCLYVAILTDTGMFQYANTTQRTHTVVGELLDSGIDQYRIYQGVYENLPIAKLRLLSESLATIKVECSGKLVYMWITNDMLHRSGAVIELTEDVINFARSVEGSVVAVVFKETTDKTIYKVSFRSKSRKVDVNKIAAQFGGGGHRAASGCMIQGPRKRIEKNVLDAIKKEIKKAGE